MRGMGLMLAAASVWGAEIHEAARTCGRAELEKALAAGVAVDARDAAGNTPLHVAVASGQFECVALLRGKGANPDAPNREGKTPRQVAAELADRRLAIRMQSALLSIPARGTAHPFQKEPLQEAARRGDVDFVAMLLKLGADPNGKGADGATALQAAALKGHGDVVVLLLEKGAKVDVGLPLHDAAVGGSVVAVRALVEHGAKVGAVDPKTGDTPLHYAATWGRVEAARALLELGADWTVKNSRGRTSAEEATASGNEELARVLR
jgi:ankyrin repeat protein